MMEEMADSMASASSVSSLVSIAAYVFTALAIYTIAQRREIKHAWLSWVPVLNVWILGSISDQYRYVVKGEVCNKRKVLLTVNILNCVLTWAAVISLIVKLVVIATSGAQMPNDMELVRKILSSFVLFIPVSILGIVMLVFRIMALYDLYSSCDPANNVLYLVLSLIPGINTVTQPLFLFLCRNQDGGMPPRREPAAENPAEL
jgi:hypothetical protein